MQNWRGVNHAIELRQTLADHATERTQAFARLCGVDCNITIQRGNAFAAAPSIMPASGGFDRIYVGAGIDMNDVRRFAAWLSEGGIMFAPVQSAKRRLHRFRVVV